LSKSDATINIDECADQEAEDIGANGDHESGEVIVEEQDFIDEHGEMETRRIITKKRITIELD
jgi:hypothetical protein